MWPASCEATRITVSTFCLGPIVAPPHERLDETI
jgi:hypothetical protein